MPRKLVLISGRICTWKTDLSSKLERRRGFERLSTSNKLRELAEQRDHPTDRKSLQALGDTLDNETDFAWVYDFVCEALKDGSTEKPVVVDHLRHRQQVERFRAQNMHNVVHIHLYADEQFLSSEFEKRKERKPEPETERYEDADPLHGNDEDINWFKKDADIRLNVTNTDAEDTFVRVCAALRINPDQQVRCVDVIVGGQFGSEGKGNIAAYLSKEYDVLVRVGGPNAGHTVASASGEFTYHQLPSGAKDCDAELLLGPGMTIDVAKLLEEVRRAGIKEDRLFIDPDAMIISEEDIQQENGLRDNISSTASGSGAAAARRIMGRAGNTKLAKDIPELEPFVGGAKTSRGSTMRRLETAFASGKSVLLEGTQGSGLSLYHGPYPYVTSRDTNVAGCLSEAGISPSRLRRVILVTRTTPIRVANPKDDDKTSGVLKYETTFDAVASLAGLDAEKVKTAEKTSTTKRDRRVGHFDWELFRKSCRLNAPTDIALTFADYISSDNQDARRFEQLTRATREFIEELELVSQARVTLINTRFPKPFEHRSADLRSIIDRRSWRGSLTAVPELHFKTKEEKAAVPEG